MSKPLNTAVLIVAFNRPDKVQAVFNSVRKVQPKKLFLSVDGARANKAGESEKVKAVQSIIKQVDWECEVKTLFQNDNLGCRLGVSSGINWFFEQVEAGIILEDDCVPNPSFYYYCEVLLERYKNEDKIMQISGSNLIPNKFTQFDDSYVFSNFGLIWGWATWRRAWQKNDIHLKIFPDFIKKEKIKNLVNDKTAQAYMIDKFEETYLKNNNSWAYAWFCILLYYDGLSILPTKNLIENIGIGEDATHTIAKGDELKRFQTKASDLTFPLQHPNKISKVGNDVAMEIFYANYKPKHLLLINKIVPISILKIYRNLKKKFL